MEKITSLRFPAAREEVEAIENPLIILLQEALKRFPVEHEGFNRESKSFETQSVKPEDLELAHFQHPDLPFSVICVGYPGKIGDGEVKEPSYPPWSKIMTLTVTGQDPVNIKITSLEIYGGKLEQMAITRSVFNLEGREVTIRSEYWRNCAIPKIRSGDGEMEIHKSAFQENQVKALIVFTDGLALKEETDEAIKRAVLFL